MLNTSVLTTKLAIRLHMFHSHRFHAPVMSPLFYPHEPYDDITLDDVRPPFHPLRYLIDGEFDFDTRLTPIIFVESDPSELSIRPTLWDPIVQSHLSPQWFVCLQFFCFIYWTSSILGSRSWVHLHPCCAPRMWAWSRRRTWRWCTQWFQERILPIRWLTWMAHAELITRITLFVGSYRIIIFLMACIGGQGSYCISFLMYLVRYIL